MRLLKGRLLRASLWPALLAIVVLGAGCQTYVKSLFTASGPGWHVQEGQALWRPRRGYPELAGDVVLATHEDGRCFVQFVKTPMALVSAQTTSNRWLIQFPPRHMSFSGHGHPPARFAWLELHAALAGEQLPSAFHFERKPEGGYRLENEKSGETLEGFLAP